MTKLSLELYLKENLSNKTAESYLYTINHFLVTDPKAKRYTFQNIVSYMEEVSRKNSNIQCRVRILSAIKKYYDFLVMVGLRNEHPCKQLTIKNKQNQSVQVQDLFSSEELKLILTRENRYQYLDSRNSVLLSLLIYQGLTSEELAELKVKDIDLDAGTIYIKASTNQNRRTLELLNKQMIVFSKYINDVRPELLRCDTDKLLLSKLGTPMSVDGIHAIIEPLKSLFPDRNLNPRTIRMSVICNWLNEKKIPLEQVQKLAGHKWPGTTEKYFKVDSFQQRELINRYFPI
ncbi:tyrosine-type recombinase/integrase [Flavobacterium sp. AED]|jgi:integrase/recombinase XerD|uniref:tyrosine-type recombinase/integrase n=1 Tax=Flavobacterium sp. AED TaxID=1423323 RepID=UPI00057E8145|nr:tyrosine-type recombinase/integrase [Flavobacterium sp. AED]KIA82457.1 integrase [Flavobacterium sp. AED]